ncbi:hypothetical protein BHE74_00053496 [Ensete ventricosum]|nr:hypothetical protein GW17_00012303 [Ensete ventricosum]RWW41047.1 hypothetical protein BHE74_00053496 [Ensete ventricosum]
MIGSIRGLSLVSTACVWLLPSRSREGRLVESPNPRFPGDLFPATRDSQRRKPRCRRRLPVCRSSLAAFQLTQACRCGCRRRDPAVAARPPPSGALFSPILSIVSVMTTPPRSFYFTSPSLFSL